MANTFEQDLEVGRYFSIPADEIEEAASRSSGPGGQHVNKSNTRVSLRWNVTRSTVPTPSQRARLLERLRVRLTRDGDLIVHAGRMRSRARNRDDARARMVELLCEALLENAERRQTRPSRNSKMRVKKAKSIRGEIKRGRGRVSRDDQ